jgi:ubiquinone/menaquinone biosynthesis C-methylase UbiE
MKYENSFKKHNDWSFRLFIEHAHLFLPIIEDLKKRTNKEIKGLRKLFNQFNISKDSRILDFSCGIGRHTIPLAKDGFTMVGYDPSFFYLEKANEFASKERTPFTPRLKFIRGSPYNASKVLFKKNELNFNAVIIMDNSFGFKNEEDDVRMLKEIYKVSSKNCILVMETENRDWRIANFEHSTFFNSKKIKMYEKWRFNFETSISESESLFYEKNKEKSFRLSLKINTTLRLYSLHELKNVLKKSGWNYLKSFGDIRTLKPFDGNSPNIITISSRM